MYGLHTNYLSLIIVIIMGLHTSYIRTLYNYFTIIDTSAKSASNYNYML